MRKLILVVHISLDGFVAGPNGELDSFPKSDENLEFVCDLTRDADAALFGRKSFELLDEYWPTARNLPGVTEGEIAFSTWYNDSRKIVISKTLAKETFDKTIIISENIKDEIIKIKEQPGKDILIFGSPSVSQLLMKHNLIDEYWIFINPLIFGEGIPLFVSTTNQTKVTLVTTRQFGNGEIAMNYAVYGNPG